MNRLSPDQWSGSDRLRREDRYIRAVLAHSPTLPRQVDDLWLPMRNGSSLLAASICVALFAFLGSIAPGLLGAIRDGSFWQLRSSIPATILGPSGILIVLYFLLEPLYAWRVGLTVGRPAVAVVVEQPAGPVRWEVTVPGRIFQTRFRVYTHEPNTWVDHLRVGDHIRVLLHPTKDKILLAYGP